ncbi:ABC transporter, periplasmic substrate-binding protein [Xylanimonas cellulosilytica DSM 15894]|uniref:ABC transporter, periplasmic substrate-binding protein n=1 Tax=Xylanimonas cellulosilytica (strain DSM 15894 / JCM 12276 / CECT 5975 / KCTC 9989 / LMG 20990 / NBRC 107835 / XIL07) TaxID=446471 RepID=D1BXX5_XYLCX|nr:extracellular solute-binding protein [Xylanimonas cellulosilytica]ACZ31766.1 ABC transporter, periplasmic substrate-binding protein [Xylanimonas cellulosilytica DSM 15894]
MRTIRTTRVRAVAAIGAISLGLTLAACAPPSSSDDDADAPAAAEDTDTSEVPATPSAPVTLNILDVAGNQKLTGGMVDEFVKENPDIISSVTWETGGAPDVTGVVKPQVDSGNLQVDLVLTGNDGLSAGIAAGLWVPIVDEYGDRLSNMDNYIEPAQKMQELAGSDGVVVTYYPSGPLLQYNPDVVTDVPSTPDELLAWAEANPGKFGYARPANSGPGRTFLMGLPYMLGDEDPKDPENGWDKTWAYLQELGQYVDNYPTGTGQVITNIADGTWALIPTTTGWDMNPRITGTQPNTIEAAPFDDFTWVTDAHYAAIPKGQSADKISAILLLLQNILTPEQNAKAYDEGYFYPGPAIEGATLDKAPQETQDAINEYKRDWFDDLIEEMPKETPLSPDQMVKAFDIWDREVGAGKYEEAK